MKNLSIKKNRIDFFNKLQFRFDHNEPVVYSREEFLENPALNNYHLFEELNRKHTISELKDKIIIAIFFSKLMSEKALNSLYHIPFVSFAGIADTMFVGDNILNLCETMKDLKRVAKNNKLDIFHFNKDDTLENYYFALDPREIIVKYILPANIQRTQDIFYRFNAFGEDVIQALISIKINPKNTFLFIKSIDSN